MATAPRIPIIIVPVKVEKLPSKPIAFPVASNFVRGLAAEQKEPILIIDINKAMAETFIILLTLFFMSLKKGGEIPSL